MRTLASGKKEQQEQAASAFFRPRTNSLVPAAADSFFKPRTPQVQRTTDDKAVQLQLQASSPETQASQMLVQRQQDGGTAPVQQPATPQPAATTGGGQPQMQPAPGQPAVPRSSWSPLVPYIWFDLHDSYKALTQPNSPYLYSSYAYRDHTVNHNFVNNLNPGPARDTTTVLPGSGRYAQPHDLLWFFYTKFYVDSAASPLPAGATITGTSADIIYRPDGGGQGFEDHFLDNNPQYLSPGGLSYPFALGTTPYGFGAQHNIMQPGTLQWDASLRMTIPNTVLPIRLVYTAPSQFPDVTAFRTSLQSHGVMWRDAAPGESAITYQLTFSRIAGGRLSCSMVILGTDGSQIGIRQLDSERGESPANFMDTMALITSLAHGNYINPFGPAGTQAFDISQTQRVRFERPAP